MATVVFSSLNINMAIIVSIALVVFLGQVSQARGLNCYTCYSQKISNDTSDRLCQNPMITCIHGIVKPFECTLHDDHEDEASSSVMNNGYSRSYNNALKVVETSPFKKPWGMKSKHCVNMIRISGKYFLFLKYLVQNCNQFFSEETIEPLVMRSCVDRKLDYQCGISQFKGYNIQRRMLKCQKTMCDSVDNLTSKLWILVLLVSVTL